MLIRTAGISTSTQFQIKIGLFKQDSIINLASEACLSCISKFWAKFLNLMKKFWWKFATYSEFYGRISAFTYFMNFDQSQNQTHNWQTMHSIHLWKLMWTWTTANKIATKIHLAKGVIYLYKHTCTLHLLIRFNTILYTYIIHIFNIRYYYIEIVSSVMLVDTCCRNLLHYWLYSEY